MKNLNFELIEIKIIFIFERIFLFAVFKNECKSHEICFQKFFGETIKFEKCFKSIDSS
jgi:hypothetical protein